MSEFKQKYVYAKIFSECLLGLIELEDQILGSLSERKEGSFLLRNKHYSVWCICTAYVIHVIHMSVLPFSAKRCIQTSDRHSSHTLNTPALAVSFMLWLLCVNICEEQWISERDYILSYCYCNLHWQPTSWMSCPQLDWTVWRKEE